MLEHTCSKILRTKDGVKNSEQYFYQTAEIEKSELSLCDVMKSQYVYL